jgi:hypothetical protein
VSKKPDSPIGLPKHLLGVKISKDTRRAIEARLAALPPAEAQDLADTVVATLLTALAAPPEEPRHEVVKMFPSRETRILSRRNGATGVH